MLNPWKFLLLVVALGGLLCTAANAQRFPRFRKQTFYGNSKAEYPTRFVRDNAGNLYLCGYVADEYGATNALVIKVGPNGEQLWRETFGGQGYEQINDALIGQDGHLFFVGVTGTAIPHPDEARAERRADYYIGRLDTENGKLIWTRTIGGSGRDVGMGIAQTSYGGLIVTGETWSNDHDVMQHDHPLNNQWIAVLNADGRVLRKKVYGGKKNDWGVDVTPAGDNGFLVAGVTNSEDLDGAQTRHNGDAWFMKLDFAGNMQWTKIVKKPYEDIIYRTATNPYGFFAAVGSQVTAEKNKQFWLLKLDAKGNTLVDKILGDTGFEELTAVDFCKDGGMILAGYSYYTDLRVEGTKGLKDVWVIRTDSRGEIQWQKSFGGPESEAAVDVMEYEDGTILVLCSKFNDFKNQGDAASQDFWVLEIEDKACGDIELDIVTDISNYRESVGTPIKFSNRSNFGDEWVWDFGDGTTSHQRSPVKTYTKPGVYNVKLTAIVNETCKTHFYYPEPVIITP